MAWKYFSHELMHFPCRNLAGKGHCRIEATDNKLFTKQIALLKLQELFDFNVITEIVNHT